MPISVLRAARRAFPRGAVLLAALAAGCRGDGTGPAGPAPGGRIVFVHELPDFNATDLRAINPDGSGETVLRRGPEYAPYAPSWAPDGRRLVFSGSLYPAGSSLYVMDADGANLRALALGVAATRPAWSPDGGRIAFVESTGGDARRAGGVWVVGPDGGAAARVPTARYGECVRTCFAPGSVRWWGGGESVAYAVGAPGGSAGGWYTTRLRDSLIEPLPAGGPGAWPDPRAEWSPDGAVAAVPWQDGIVVRTAAGAEVGRVAAPAPQFGTTPEVSWAPDGQWFAYGAYVFTDVAAGRGRYELWVARRDGSGPRRLALDAHAPAWQPTPR